MNPLLRIIFLQIPMNMEMSSTAQMEVPTSEDLQRERDVDLGILINLSNQMQEVMQQMSRKMNLGTKQGVEITLKREVQEEIINPHTKMNTNQRRGRNCPADYAKKLHIQTYLGAQILKSIYQSTQRKPRVFQKKYAKIV